MYANAFRSWIRKLSARYLGTGKRRGTSRSGASHEPAAKLRLMLETLEARVVPASVTLATDPGTLTAGTLRYVLASATSGETITFASGMTIDLNSTLGPLAVTNNVTIVGLGTGNTIIDGQGNVEIFNIASSATVSMSSLTIEHGAATVTGPLYSGGGIYNAGNLTLSNAVVTNNTASIGGGIYNTGSLTLTNVTLSENTGAATSGGGGGGGIENFGAMTLSNVTVSGNATGIYGSGGGIGNYGSMTLTNSTISDNWAGSQSGQGGQGGGIFNQGTATLSNVTLSNNTAVFGGIMNWNSLTVSEATISNNSANYGGAGVYDITGTATLSNVTLSGNTATTNYGGGILSLAHTTLNNVTIFGNSAPSGGGIYAGYNTGGDELALSQVTVASNTADTGGGLYLYTGSVFYGYPEASATLLNSIVADNSAGSDPDVSGAIDVASHSLIGNATGVTIVSSTSNQVGVSALSVGLASTLASNGGPTQRKKKRTGLVIDGQC
jgi:hypothetical protein